MSIIIVNGKQMFLVGGNIYSARAAALEALRG